MAQLALGVAGLALLLGLADAEDRLEPGLERRRDLQRQRLVGLAEELAALGVAEHDAVDVELDRASRRDLAGERARFGLVHVLRVDLARASRAWSRPSPASAVNGGQIADVDARRQSDTRGSSAWMNSSASATVLCIFQLPAISGRCARSCQRLHPGQRFALDQLERGAAAGRQMRDPVGQPELLRAPPPSRRRRRRSSPGAAATASATARVPAANGVELERPHRTVPEHGAGVRDRSA